MIPKEWLQYAPKPKPVSKDEVWNVFLSYRSVNRAWVLGLYDVLTELGHKVFFDQYVLKAGDNLSGSLYDGLNRSQAGVLIWSAANLDLERFGKEYYNLERKAIDNKKFIFVYNNANKTIEKSFSELLKVRRRGSGFLLLTFMDKEIHSFYLPQISIDWPKDQKTIFNELESIAESNG